MKLLLSAIEDVLRAEDIEDLIRAGAPADEYDDEAKDILAALKELEPDALREAEIVAVIADVWAKAFNRSSLEISRRMPAFRRIAQKLL